MPASPEILLSADEIQKAVAELAHDIRRDFPGDVHLVAVLKGAFVFLADLMRQMSGELSIDFIALSSYAEARRAPGRCGSSKTWTWGSTERTLSSSKTSSIPDGRSCTCRIFSARASRVSWPQYVYWTSHPGARST